MYRFVALFAMFLNVDRALSHVGCGKTLFFFLSFQINFAKVGVWNEMKETGVFTKTARATEARMCIGTLSL
jgi:hypothetical protein